MSDATNSNAEEGKVKEFRFGRGLNQFLRESEALSGAFSHAQETLNRISEAKRKDFFEFVKENVAFKDKNEGQESEGIKSQEEKRKLRVTSHVAPVLIAKLNDNLRIDKSAELLPRSLFVGLVSQFDAFIASLARDIFTLKPETLYSSSKSFTYKELKNFSSIDEFSQYLIDEEIEKLIWKSRLEQISWLEKIVDCNTEINGEIKTKFVELTERRNLFVHNNGVVNRQYIDKCSREHLGDIDSYRIGKDTLQVDAKYFIEATRVLNYIAVLLTQLSWRKLLPHEKNNANNSLIQLSYDALEAELFDYSLDILELALSRRFINEFSHRDKLILEVNKILCYKLTDQEEEVRRMVEDVDWSGCEPEFRLAKAVLLDDFAAAAKLMEDVGGEGSIIDRGTYARFPLFKYFRSAAEFKDKYKQLYGSDFDSDITNIGRDEPYHSALIKLVEQ